MRATSFIGSSRESVRVHQRSRNWPAQRRLAPQRLKVLLEQVANRARLRRTSSASRPRCSGELLRTLEQEPAAALEHRRPAPRRRASGRREGSSSTRAGTLVRAAGVQAVSPAQRGRSGATRLAAAIGSDADPQILRKTQHSQRTVFGVGFQPTRSNRVSSILQTRSVTTLPRLRATPSMHRY